MFSQAPWYSLPTHVCPFTVRSARTYSIEVFPGSVGSITLWSKLLVITPQRFNKSPDLPKLSAYMLKPPSIRWLIYPPALPHLQSRAGTGILTRFPSTTPFGLVLGAD